MTGDDLGRLRLPRLLKPGLRLVFIGYNPGVESARQGHYYAFRGNVFWRQLYESGLAPHPVSHLDDRRLFERHGIGFIDLCERPTARASELSAAELRDGAERLHRDLVEVAPAVAVFGGRGIFQQFARHGLGLAPAELKGRADGLQPERICGPGGSTAIYVVPSSSGLASRWHRERLRLLKELRRMLDDGSLT